MLLWHCTLRGGVKEKTRHNQEYKEGFTTPAHRHTATPAPGQSPRRPTKHHTMKSSVTGVPPTTCYVNSDSFLGFVYVSWPCKRASNPAPYETNTQSHFDVLRSQQSVCVVVLGWREAASVCARARKRVCLSCDY